MQFNCYAPAPNRRALSDAFVWGAENARVENTGVENAGVDRSDGKCRSGKCRSDNVWKAVRRENSKIPVAVC